MIAEALRLHIGGTEPREGWKILNAQPFAGVDFVGDCTDLGGFVDNSVDEIYASHVYEHLGYHDELPRAISEAHRVLKPGGTIRIGVPDLDILCRLFVQPHLNAQDRVDVMRMIFGGQTDRLDYHKVGLSEEILTYFLRQAGFQSIQRVNDFGIFHDSTSANIIGRRISLNIMATKGEESRAAAWVK